MLANLIQLPKYASVKSDILSAFLTKTGDIKRFNDYSAAKVSLGKSIPTVNSNCEDSFNPNSYLSIKTIQKMLKKLLYEKNIPQEQLALHLQISVRSLMRLVNGEKHSILIREINLPLIKLYCETKFEKQTKVRGNVFFLDNDKNVVMDLNL